MNTALKELIQPIAIDSAESLLTALKQMDLVDRKLLLVFENGKFKNVLSVGDVQRAILGNMPLESRVGNILRNKSRIANEDESVEQIMETMRKSRIECMPVVNASGELVNVHFWEDVFGDKEKRVEVCLNLPVVIMAGGRGTRLKPLTNVIPKPLLPIGDKTIIEEIMSRFMKVGCHIFHLSVNYKAETIKHYFEQLGETGWTIDYFQEDKPLGTAGSLYLVKDKLTTTFFVSNCDIIINEDYSELLKYHRQSKNELTIVSALKHYSIPYGTIETTDNGKLASLKEKPELLFQINTGMYILEPHLLKEVPENQFFHITHLIEKIKNREGQVGVFPISEGSWTDIGEWDGYLSMFKR